MTLSAVNFSAQTQTHCFYALSYGLYGALAVSGVCMALHLADMVTSYYDDSLTDELVMQRSIKAQTCCARSALITLIAITALYGGVVLATV